MSPDHVALARLASRAHAAVLFAALALAPAVRAQTAPSAQAAKRSEQGQATSTHSLARSRYQPDRFAGKAGRYYKAVFGIDDLSVKLVESGELVRFVWRVLDPDRAKLLNDKKFEPALVDPRAGVSLVVPKMEKVGPLRQGMPPEAGKSYWMAFSNKGRMVKRGDRVNVVIGGFRADGLVVD
ncbi:MAG TPA: hypothetical protein VFG53_10715 [Anaeromyxobacter sp.]|nr:hypothetical protein [Anaeromyxobacter sp.]